MKVREVEDFPSREEAKVFKRAEYLGFRDEILGELVEEYKYQAIRGEAREIAEVVFRGYFLKEFFRRFPSSEILLVPMPTSRKHIRERGFDHMGLVAEEISRLSSGQIRVAPLLSRKEDTTQVGADEEVRRKQAKSATEINLKTIDSEDFSEVKVVLLDDVWTTGASMIEAGKKLKRELRKVGVEEIFGLTITKNRLGKSPVIRGGEVL